jgi:hypothetical protein
LKPFLRPFHTGAVVNSVGGTGSGIVSGPAGNDQIYSIYMLSQVSGKDRSHSIAEDVSNRADNESEELQQPLPERYRPHQIAGIATVKGGASSDVRTDDIESLESNDSQQMIIRTTKRWSVTYESRIVQ